MESKLYLESLDTLRSQSHLVTRNWAKRRESPYMMHSLIRKAARLLSAGDKNECLMTELGIAYAWDP